jgi:hypothetical protein
MNKKIFTLVLILTTLLKVNAFGQTGDIVYGNLIQFNDNGAWCWYQDERAVVDTANGKLLLGSDASDNGVGGSTRDGLIEAVIFDLETGLPHRFTLADFSCDDHNAPAFFVRPDGNYIAMYTQHYDYYNSRYRIYNGSSWSSEQTFDWTTIPGGINYTIAYSNMYYLSDEERMYNFARANNRCPNFIYSDNMGDNWLFGGQLSTNNTSSYNKGYYKYWSNSIDRIDFICTEEHPRDGLTSMYHGYVQNGQTHDTYGTVVDTNTFDQADIPSFLDFTLIFADNTEIDDDYMRKIWNADLMRYDDGTIAAILTCRINNAVNGNDPGIDPDHAFIYCRFNGSNWSYTYLGQAGKKMYSTEADYTGLGALHPNDPNTIYISTHIDPSTDLDITYREIFKGVTSDNGATWTWTPVTKNSNQHNFRPIIPKWKEGHTALLWFRGTYYQAQNFDAAIVGIIENSTDSTVLMSYADATSTNTFLADGLPLSATGPSSGAGASDNNWHWRTTYGNGDAVLTSAESSGGEDAPVIKTQATDIEEGTYDVWANFWANPESDWRIEAGLRPENMQIFRQMACKQVMSQDHNTELVLTGGGNTFLYQAYLGRVVIETGDTLNVFIDDEAIQTGTTNTQVGDVCRTWYDGISYSHPGRHPGDLSLLEYKEYEKSPLGFNLQQNYPNPFSSITNISYTLSDPSHVKLSVYNMLGQEVAELINEKMSTGSHSIKWNAGNITSGIYFMRMTVGDNSITKKTLIVK